jgi:hypothetical protein
LAVAALLSLLGCVLADHWQMGLIFVVLSGFWWGQQQRGMPWHTAVFVIYIGALALAGALNVDGGWLLSSAVAVLVSWDLNLFLQQPGADNLVNESLLVRLHLRALGQVAVIALLLGWAVLLIRIRLYFWMAYVLALAVILLLNNMMREVVDE